LNSTTGTPPDDLRTKLVDGILTAQPISPAVEAAMRAVPRHEFVPDAPLEEAYADVAVITKRAADGTSLSCASVPSLVARMLDHLQVEPGNRILEIGAGTGYNAALLAHLTRPIGTVTTIDIDPEITAGARRGLDVTGFTDVKVITRDGALGAPEHAPYDRMIVTVGAWDLPRQWWDQLAPGGRLVVPLRWRGQTRAIAFVRGQHEWRSDWVELCGFVPMIGQEGEHTATIDGEGSSGVSIWWDEDQAINPQELAGVLNSARGTTWSVVTVAAGESFDGLWLRLAATHPGICRIAAGEEAVQSQRCTPAIAVRSPALIEGDSLAYLALQRADVEGQRRWKLGAISHGPDGPRLAQDMIDGIHAWAKHRDDPVQIRAWIGDDPHTATPETLVIRKPHIWLSVEL
jgi:protein-L-isoaspartate(D-aspartate) O-methyltransferase